MRLRTWGIIAAILIIVTLIYTMFAEGNLEDREGAGPPAAIEQMED